MFILNIAGFISLNNIHHLFFVMANGFILFAFNTKITRQHFTILKKFATSEWITRLMRIELIAYDVRQTNSRQINYLAFINYRN